MKIDNNYFTRTDVNLSSKVFWLFLWLGGLFYTGRIIVNSSKRYLRYPAQIYEREGDAGKLIFRPKNFADKNFSKRLHFRRFWSAQIQCIHDTSFKSFIHN